VLFLIFVVFVVVVVVVDAAVVDDVLVTIVADVLRQ